MGATRVPRISAKVVLPKPALQGLLDNLRAAGFIPVGPTISDGAIVLEELESMDQLPVGWEVQKQPGRYRLARTKVTDHFGWSVGPHSWKRYLYPARSDLFRSRKTESGWIFEPVDDNPPKYAFIGVRPCDLQAIDIQDRVFLNERLRDPYYARRRERIFILAVNCTAPAATCFCSSMRTGPRATAGGFDLVLTELSDSCVMEIGSEAGSEMLSNLEWQPASAFDLGRVAQAVEHAERQIQRELRTDDLPQLLYSNLEHPRWDAVGARCLSCGNCTLVCPTCFCSTVEDRSDLRGQSATRTRTWDSCFVLDFSHVHGGNIRPTVRSRYRQWLTHKLASWIDQFGTSGCVGCGRCMTWCPVGIDLTEEIRAIRTTGAK